VIFLNKQQISSILDVAGQPKGSILLNNFFNSYRSYLNSSDVADLYDDAYREKIKSHEAAFLVQEKYPINIFNKYSYEYLLKKINSKSKILDLGCGSGDFSFAIACKGPEMVFGVDFSKEAIEEANGKLRESTFNNLNFVCADIADYKVQFPFDFIVLNDVIEHLSDRELEKLFAILPNLIHMNSEIVMHTPNGLALCNKTDTNYFQSLYECYLRIFKGWKGFERSIDQIYYDQVHINIKSFRQLRLLLKRNRFKSRVLYDEECKFSFKSQLSSNMLVIAKPIC